MSNPSERWAWGPPQKAMLGVAIFTTALIAINQAIPPFGDSANKAHKNETLKNLVALSAPDTATLRRQHGYDADLYFITDLHTADGQAASISGSFSADTGAAAAGRDIFIFSAGTKKENFDPTGLINFSTEVINRDPNYKAEGISNIAIYVRSAGSTELRLANPDSQAYKNIVSGLKLQQPATVKTLKGLFIRQAKDVEAQAIKNFKAGQSQPAPGN